MTRGRQSNKRSALAKPPAPDTAVLGPDECAVWIITCKQQNAEWLDTGPGPLLENYCFAVVRMRCLRSQMAVEARDHYNKGRIASATDLVQLDTLSRMVERLARALRLTPQSRVRADKADNVPGMPWEQGGNGDSD